MESKSLPKVSVIICCYTFERLNDIYNAIESIRSQTLKPYELIISVDHNNDLYNKLQSEFTPPVKLVLNNGAPGFCETKNEGIRVATGDIVAFLDDDAIAELDWLEELVKSFQSSE